MSANANRLEKGGLIDRQSVINFRFNGRPYKGYEGDTLASALLANGVSLTARSFKYHRPRGIIGVGPEEPGTLVELLSQDASGNQPATTVRLRDGLEAQSVNCWPSPSLDVMSVNQWFSRLLPAAFYYKTFMWPDWHWFEPAIRRAAGLANAPAIADSGKHYEIRHAHCEALIVGAGPAGLLAATLVAKTGVRVLLVDEGVKPGGSLLSQRCQIDGLDGVDWVARTVAALDAMDNVTRLSTATAWAYREHNYVLVTERSPDNLSLDQRSWRVRADHVVLATGAIERNLVFAHNDRPGVQLASAIQSYVNRYAVKPGNRAVLFANNNSIYPVARDLMAAGIEIAAIVDSRRSGDFPEITNIPVYRGHVIERCYGARRVTGVKVVSREDGRSMRIACDLVGVSGGWNPTVHLYSQSRSQLRFDQELAAYVPGDAAQSCHCIGGAAGIFSLDELIADSATRISQIFDFTGDVQTELPDVSPQPRYHIEALWHVDVDRKLANKSFIDIQNDVTLSDVHLAIREGFGAVEHVKRYTTAGMGIDQGKVGNLNVIGAIAEHTQCDPGQIGVTTFRSPYTPIDFGAMVGTREGSVFLPYRHTPITHWNQQHGATMYEAGARWRRPGFYPRPGESFQQTVNRESSAVRENVAVYDGAPLGKFEIKGPDAARLLDMLYTNDFSTLATGNGRYGLMLSEDGLILDDGVTFKLADNHYFMSTSTAHADAVNQHMENFLQTHRPEWQAYITTITSQWANATICGPRARELMQALDTDIDLSTEAFPFMSFRDGRVAGFNARVCRVSFTGELSFEINVRSREALALWEAVVDVGRDFDLTPIGSEANHVLRVEKGFLSLGHEADGTTGPDDLGMGWIVSRTKSDFIGRKALDIRRRHGQGQRQLVGLLPDDPEHLIDENAPITPGGRREKSEGLVTACVWSVVNNRVIALALLENGRARKGETVHIRRKDKVVTATVTEPCFHDPKGLLLRS